MTSGTGTCKVFFHQAGNNDYAAAPTITESVTATPVPNNVVTFTTPAPPSAEYGSSFTVAASGLGTGAISYTSDGVVCTNVNATYTMISGTGTCTVTATQAADRITVGERVGIRDGSTGGSQRERDDTGSVHLRTAGNVHGDHHQRHWHGEGTQRTQGEVDDLNGSVSWSANTGCSASAVTGNSPETATCTTSSLGAARTR